MSLPRSLISSRHVFEDGDDDVSLQFPLSYAGSLPSKQTGHGVVQTKHDIRRQLHTQLRDLVRRSPELQLLVGTMQGENYDSRIGQSLTDLAAKGRIKGFASPTGPFAFLASPSVARFSARRRVAA